MKKNLLFFGELPNNHAHGVSISNRINIEILQTKYNVVISEETTSLNAHSKKYFLKTLQFLKNIIEFIHNIRKQKYHIFYSTLYLSTFGFLKNISTIFIFKMFNKNSTIILHIHRSDFSDFYKHPLNHFFFNLINKKHLKLIVLSKQQLTYLNSLGINNCNLLYNTIEFNPEGMPKYNYIKNKHNVLYISNYIIEKGIINLINVFNKHFKDSNIYLNCFGSFSNEISKIYLDDITKDNLNIKINGPIYNTDKIDAILNSDLVVLPTYNEGLPLVLLESIALDKPIVISNVGFIDEVLGSDYPFYCLPNNEDDLFEKIMIFVNNKELYSEQGCFKKYFQNFTLEKHSTELLKIFN